MSPPLGHKRPLLRHPERASNRGAEVPPPCPDGKRLDLRAERPDLLGIVVVTGSASNAGKTWLCERILERAKAAGIKTLALKVTRTHINSCPRENDGCGVCDRLEVPYRFVTDRESLDVPKKDTGRYFAAGATAVLWLLTKPSAVAEACRAALRLLPPGHLIVAEGNSFQDYVQANRCVMALTDAFEMKPSAEAILDRIDAFALGPMARGGLVTEAVRRRCQETPVLSADEAALFALAPWLPPAGWTRGGSL